MKTLALISMLIVAALATTEAHAGDKNSIYFSQQSGLARVGFSGTACGGIPMPSVSLDGERSCARVPTTFLYRKTDSNGVTTREVRKLEDIHDESCTRGVDANGSPTETCSIKVTSGRSVDGNFGRKQSFSIMGATFGDGESDSSVARTFASGLAAARRSTQPATSAP